jgi:hypothetical protein
MAGNFMGRVLMLLFIALKQFNACSSWPLLVSTEA